MTILLDSSQQCCFLGIEMIRIFSPDADKKRRTSRNRSWNRVGESIAV
jgi:hypothetical protein